MICWLAGIDLKIREGRLGITAVEFGIPLEPQATDKRLEGNASFD